MLALPLLFNVDCPCAAQLSTLPLPLRFNVEVRTWSGYLRWIRKQTELKAPRIPNPANVSIPCSYLNIESEGEEECGELSCTKKGNATTDIGRILFGIAKKVFSLFVRCMDSVIQENVGITSTM